MRGAGWVSAQEASGWGPGEASARKGPWAPGEAGRGPVRSQGWFCTIYLTFTI